MVIRPFNLKRKPKTILLTVGIGAAWVCAVGIGLQLLFNYETAAGPTGIISRQWPAETGIHLDGDSLTLLMFAHPQCPCTRASVNELSQIIARAQGKVRAYVLFYTPSTTQTDWENTDLRRSAAQIPGVTVLSDADGTEAKRFGAETSGHTFLFDRTGHLLFNGGITASRGHSGDNVGENAVISMISEQQFKQSETLVFGCSFNRRALGDKGAACLR